MLDAAAAGAPCPKCGKADVIKERFLGGAIHYCPKCQPPPAKRRTKSAKA